MWAVRPINAAQRRPQAVQVRLLDGAASSELEFAARALRRLRFSYLECNAVLLEVLHTGVTDFAPFLVPADVRKSTVAVIQHAVTTACA